MVIREEMFRLMNEVKDNLWLGDVSEAKKIINELLQREANRDKSKFTLKTIDETYKKISSNIKEIKGFERSFILSKNFKDYIKEKEINFEDEIIISSLFDYLEKMAKGLEYISEDMMTTVIKEQYYKYRILEHYNKYEVRGLLKKEPCEDYIEVLTKKLKEINFNVSVLAKTERYTFLIAFSLQSYIEMLVFFPRVNIVIVLPSPNKEKAQNLFNMIMAVLIK